MKNIEFPLKFKFKVTTLANDFKAEDKSGNIFAYVRQKMFKMKEDIQIFKDESKSEILYTIKADRWLDFSAAYSFYDAENREFGKVVRKGLRSFWKAEYHILDRFGKAQFIIREENGWVKVLDGLFSEIPVIGYFTGYVFNPTYLVKDKEDNGVIRLKKDPTFMGSKFTLNQVGVIEEIQEERVILGLMMMILLERRRG